MAELFNVVFSGQLAAGADPAAVRANVAKLFKVNDAMLDKLFSGQRIAVKKACDQATAMKLRASLKQAGALAQMERCDDQGKPLAASAPSPAPAPVTTPAAASSPAAAAAPAPAQAAPTQRVAPAAAAAIKPAAAPPPVSASAPASSPAASVPPVPARAPTMAERIAALAAQQEREASAAPKAAAGSAAEPATADGARADSWKMFPAGSQLGEVPRHQGLVPPVIDLTRYSVARVGVELMQPEERAMMAPPPVVVPDLSAIKVAPPGAPVLRDDEKNAPPPVVVDISALSMAPPNTEVLKDEEKRVVVPVEVDISSLSMAPPGTELEEIRVEKVLVNPDTSRLSVAPM